MASTEQLVVLRSGLCCGDDLALLERYDRDISGLNHFGFQHLHPPSASQAVLSGVQSARRSSLDIRRGRRMLLLLGYALLA